MFLVMILAPDLPGVWFTHEHDDLATALKNAEAFYRTGVYQCVKVVEAGAVKVKWGPEDPGGVFNGLGTREE